MKQMVTSLFGMFGSAVALLFGGWDIALQTLVLFMGIEYSCAATPQIRQTGNRLSGLAETAYASLLAQCFV